MSDNWLFISFNDGNAPIYYNLSNDIKLTYDSSNVYVKSTTSSAVYALNSISQFYFILWDGDSPSGQPYQYPADVNQDKKVSISDATNLIDALQKGTTDSKYDVNRDGKVDIQDFEKLRLIMLGQ